MPLFYYKAEDAQGEIVRGRVEAQSLEAASDLLVENGLTVISIKMRDFFGFLHTISQHLTRITSRDLVIFFRQLSVMTSANLPLVRSLKILIEQTANKRFKSLILEIADAVEGGTRFSQALSRYPNVFNRFVVNIIKSGETSGQLDIVLGYLADQKEKDYNILNKVKGAMLYPVFILLALFVVGVLMLIFVIPKMVNILTESGAPLPISTKILVGVSNFFVSYGWTLLIILAIFIVVIWLYIRTIIGRVHWDSLKIRLPVLGKLFLYIYLVRITRSLNTLLAGGVPLTTSLHIVSEVVGNEVFKDIMLKTAKEVDDGNSIATVLERIKFVPPMVWQMMMTGEQTGKLQEMVERLADFYSGEIERGITNLVTVIEPLVVIIMGVGVAILMSAILLPVYNLASSI